MEWIGRGALFGTISAGLLGCATGLIIGLQVYAPTAWAATLEVGTPAALIGGLLGAFVGAGLLTLRGLRSL